jgi:hypothetical protein
MCGSGIEHGGEHGIRWKYVEVDRHDPEKDKRQFVFPLLAVFVHHPICLFFLRYLYLGQISLSIFLFPIIFVRIFSG